MFNRISRKGIAAAVAALLGAQAILFGAGAEEASASVASGEVVVESFEQTTGLFASAAQARGVRLDLVSRPETIHYGFHAVKLSYDFTGTAGTSAAYVNFRDPSGTTGRTMPGKPTRIGVWVYGDGNDHWLRGQLQDASGTRTAVDFTTSSGLNWEGWKFVTAAVPAAMAAPIKLNQLYVAETKADNKNAGAIYFDQLRAFYGNFSVYGLDLAGVPPLAVGEAAQARAFATYANASAPTPVASGLSFASSDPAVATVDASGVVTAVGVGTAAITARYAGAPEASYAVTVAAESVAPERLEASGPTRLEAGANGEMRAYAVYAGLAEPVAALDGVTFASSDPGVAAIDAAGRVAAVAKGTATLTATYRGASTELALEVTDPVPVLQSIEVAGLRAMIVGSTQQAKVLGTYTWLPAPVDVTADAAFASSDPSVATVGADGTVVARAFGTSRITATFGGKTASHYLVVNEPHEAPKAELRAAWIATVDNVDWPRKGVTDAATQQQDYVELLDELQAAGMNAVIMQIKPTADAFYPSEYGPWSEWLTGQQGKDPGYNPLAFTLEEAHKRNLEFHAWFNPYRISLQDDVTKLVPDHPARLHPEWVVSYGGKLYFDPGIPEAKQFIIDGIMEVVEQYDIDAVHFDDYFYPYPVAGVDFPDQRTYETYGAGFANKADWRRHNVNTFVQEVAEAIKAEKPHVKFGISPFGIWKNKSQDPTGSDTNGLSSYDAIYADSKTWVEQEWIDYITPQIYWYMGYSPAAYDVLVEWWSDLVKGKNVHLYSGQAVYRIGSADPAWQNPDEMPNQVAYNRNYDEVRGSMYFSAKWFGDNPLGFTDRLKNELYREPALVPVMPWLGGAAPQAPAETSATARGGAGVELTWQDGGASAGDEAAYYVVYRFDGAAAGDTSRPEAIVGTARAADGAVQRFTDGTAASGATYTYVVTAVSRLHRESVPSAPATVRNVPDVEAPTTTAVASGEERNGWYVSRVTVTLTAVDNDAGAVRTETSFDDGATWRAYDGPIVLDEDGTHRITYRSADAAGNVEAAKTLAVGIDRTAPTILFEGARSYAIDEFVVVSCVASDTVSGVVYDPCIGAVVSMPALEVGVGTHEATVSAVDAAGNVGTAAATFAVEAPDGAVLARLIETYVSGPGEEGIQNSLIKKAEPGNLEAFANEVRALTGKRLTEEQAAMLLAVAELL
ncbi:family 10 glycosylhydrolase [Paenibacillus sp.]|uniref:family 10 glycosylhydrolase n=1 Tax=Paenibacillus sp. TaxID=58172 RepID=UPI00281143F8|nr:family 10 glycosylhydrolase [Paenibacillus sp.]